MLEAIPLNGSLKTLGLSCCRLGYEEAFALEIATMAHLHLGTLLLADNPLGRAGLASIIRLIANCKAGQIEWCDLADTRVNQPMGTPYNPADPSGHYSLNFAWPHHRMVMWRLLLWCDSHKVGPGDILTDGSFADSATSSPRPMK